MNKKPLILDVDTGVDDAMAMMLALVSPELDVRAVTVCGGNIALDKCVLNTVRMAHYIRETLKPQSRPVIARGLEAPGGGDASSVHGGDGLGGISDTLKFDGEAGCARRDACDEVRNILEQAHSEGEKVTIVPTGPETNLAHWVREMPELLKSNIGEIIAMGGSFFTGGNVTPAAEFNIWRNPQAAADVLAFCTENGIPITYTGLDVTYQVLLRREMMERLVSENPDNKRLRFLQDLTRVYMESYKRIRNLPGCAMHDPLALSLAVRPEFCTRESFLVQIETQDPDRAGATTATPEDDSQSNKTMVCTAVDADAFLRFFLERVTGIQNFSLES